MATTEMNPIEAESARVERWRAEALEKAGFDVMSAQELAAQPHVDVHRAIALVESGCPPDLAVQILI